MKSDVELPSIKHQEQVLREILRHIPKKYGFNLYKPAYFEDKFSFNPSAYELRIILEVLASKELIKVEFNARPDEYFIYSITATAKGYDYFPQKSRDTAFFWLPIIVSSLTAVTASLLALLLR